MSDQLDYEKAIKRASRDPHRGLQKLLELASSKAEKNQKCYNSKGITKLVDFSNKTTDAVWNSYEFREAKKTLYYVVIYHQLLKFSLKALFIFVTILSAYLSFITDDLAVIKAVTITITTVMLFFIVLTVKFYFLQRTVIIE